MESQAGACLYVALRRRWEPYFMEISAYMEYDWSEIAPVEQQLADSQITAWQLENQSQKAKANGQK